MSLYHYQQSQKLQEGDPSFYSLIMAAIKKADTDNLTKLKDAWPEVVAELEYRYWSGGGLLPGEQGYDERYDDNIHQQARNAIEGF